MRDIIELTHVGLYCPAGDFYIDPYRPCNKAIVTHAHADHLRAGNKHYLVPERSKALARTRLGEKADIDALAFDEKKTINGVTVSFHPAGHVLGSAQVRLEYKGYVAVISGDYKRESDKTCEGFELVPCNLFISEATFGLPIYKWQKGVSNEIAQWWRANAANGVCSIIFSYALGKSQRILAELPAEEIGPIFTHGAVEKINGVYRDQGVSLPATRYVQREINKNEFRKALVIAPPSALGTPWLKRFTPYATAFASGWMTVRGNRRRKAVDKGFVVSDHADWPGLIDTITATGAETVYVTHGFTAPLARYVTEQGIDCKPLEAQYLGEGDKESAELLEELSNEAL